MKSKEQERAFHTGVLHLQGKQGDKIHTKTFLVHVVGHVSKLSAFLHFHLWALNTIPLTDFTQYFYCALLLRLDKSVWLAQSKHLRWGEVHSGLNEYTVKKRHWEKVGMVFGHSFIYKALCPRSKPHASYFQWCQCIKFSPEITGLK